jgi:hypothetical protein
VFRLIGRNRLASIWADPESGALRMGVACACHAIAFEFRPGILVIDLRDGPPPEGSSFETGLDGRQPGPIEARAAARPRARPAQAVPLSLPVAIAAASRLDRAPDTFDPSRISGQVVAEEMRDDLIRTLARGAAEGVVDLELPVAPAPDPGPPAASLRLRLHDRPGMVITPPEGDAQPPLTAQGSACIPDDALDLAAWGSEEPVALALSGATQDLYGEFDRPSPEAATRAVRYLLWLGFGAEARQLAQALLPEAEQTPVWASLGHLIDGSADPEPAFAAMAACDGSAALWAALTEAGPGTGAALNTQALRRAFAGLPAHLRLHLGPRLAERLRGRTDEATLQSIIAATSRSPGTHDADVAVLQARTALAAGEAAEAEAQLQDHLRTGGEGPTAEALIALVEARIAQSLPVAPEQVSALEALLAESAGAPVAADLGRALVLARAGAGNFAEAIAGLAEEPALADTVWGMVASQAEDDAFLRHAVLPAGTATPEVAPATRTAIAARLEGLGLGGPALAWLGTPPADRLLAARALLLQRDARGALRLLAGNPSPEAAEIRARAGAQLGQGAGTPAPSAGAPPDLPAASAAPLAEAGALIEESRAIRQAAADLLKQKPPPLLP